MPNRVGQCPSGRGDESIGKGCRKNARYGNVQRGISGGERVERPGQELGENPSTSSAQLLGQTRGGQIERQVDRGDPHVLKRERERSPERPEDMSAPIGDQETGDGDLGRAEHQAQSKAAAPPTERGAAWWRAQAHLWQRSLKKRFSRPAVVLAAGWCFRGFCRHAMPDRFLESVSGKSAMGCDAKFFAKRP